MAKKSIVKDFLKFFSCGKNKQKKPKAESLKLKEDEEKRRNQIIADLFRASFPW